MLSSFFNNPLPILGFNDYISASVFQKITQKGKGCNTTFKLALHKLLSMKYQIGQRVTVMGHTATILSIDAKKKKYKVQMPNFIMEVSESIINP